MSMGTQTVHQFALSATLITVLLTGGVLSPCVATAATYYVATTGSDANPGSQSQPFQTIDRGVSVLQAGDTLYIRGGTYNPARFGQNASVPMPSGTSWTNTVTIAGYPGETATMAGHLAGISFVNNEHYIIFDNIHINGSNNGGWNSTNGVHHIRFQNGSICCNNLAQNINGSGEFIEWINNDMHSSAAYAWYWAGKNCLIERNRVHDNAGYGIHLYASGYFGIDNNTIRNNIIYNNGFGFLAGYNINGGLIISRGTGNKVINNVMYGNFAGIQVDGNCTNCEVYNNTVYGTAETEGIVIVVATGTIVKNNLVYRNRYSGITNYGDASAVIDHNWTDSDGDPTFVNTATNDFRLQPTSLAINAGVAVSLVTMDVNGVARPQGAGYDIGAYEYQVSTVPAPLPAPKNLKAISVAP